MGNISDEVATEVEGATDDEVSAVTAEKVDAVEGTDVNEVSLQTVEKVAAVDEFITDEGVEMAGGRATRRS